MTWELQVNDRVRLKPDRSEIYAMAPSYAEGWIRGRRVDPVGDFKMVYVEWDPKHWAYNGQPDMWTFEDHFDKVVEDMAEPSKNDLATALGILAKGLGVDLGASEQPEEQTEGEKRAEAVTPERMKQFEAVFERAVEVARDSDAFIIACVKKEDAPEGSGAKFALKPAFFSYSMSPESSVLLDAQLAEVVAEAHQALAVTELRRLLDQDS